MSKPSLLVLSRPQHDSTAVLVRRRVFSITLLLVLVLLLIGTARMASATSKKKGLADPASAITGSGGVYTLYTVTGCGECTVNLSQRWCPTTMRCYAADNCTCDGPVPCIDLQTCFYGSRPRCQECVDSGGVFCAGGTSALTPRGRIGAQEVRCYPPQQVPHLPATADGEAKKPWKGVGGSGANLSPALATCDASTCPGGECIRLAAECPAEVYDSLSRSYEIISAVAVLVLTFLVLRNVFRLIF